MCHLKKLLTYYSHSLHIDIMVCAKKLHKYHEEGNIRELNQVQFHQGCLNVLTSHCCWLSQISIPVDIHGFHTLTQM